MYVAATIVLLFVASEFYTAERIWSKGRLAGEQGIEDLPLRIALDKCVAIYDPIALRKLRLTGSYQTSGWFLPKDHWAKVARCMRTKGWLLMPVHIYSI